MGVKNIIWKKNRCSKIARNKKCNIFEQRIKPRNKRKNKYFDKKKQESEPEGGERGEREKNKNKIK